MAVYQSLFQGSGVGDGSSAKGSPVFSLELTEQEKYDAALLDVAVRSGWGADFPLLVDFVVSYAGRRSGLSVQTVDKYLAKRARVFDAVDESLGRLAGLAVGTEVVGLHPALAGSGGQAVGSGLLDGMPRKALNWCVAKLRWMSDEEEPKGARALDELVGLRCALFTEVLRALFRRAQVIR